MSIRVIIADDYALAREGMAVAMRSALPGVVIDFADTIAQAESLARMGPPDRYQLALLDLILPDTQGFTGLLRLQMILPKLPIAIITACREPNLAVTARSLGAVAFLRKDRSLTELTEALRLIAAGSLVFPQSHAVNERTSSLQHRIATLSNAQRRVLFALADGRLNKQIAGDLAVTEATIKAHMSAVMRKLGVQNRMQAMLMMQPLLGNTRQEQYLDDA